MDLGLTYSPSYFSIQDILASHVRVPVVTKVKFPRLGHLDSSINSEDLPPEVKMELPYWIVQVLTSRNRNYVIPEMPKIFRQSYMDAIKADPSVVDLSKMGPYFYQTALHLTGLNTEEADKLGEALPNILQHRLRELADSLSYETKILKLDDDPLTKQGPGIKISQLDSLEQRVYDDSKKSSVALSDWLEKR